MFNRKIIYEKPSFPRNFGKKKKRRRKLDLGAILEAAFIIFLVAVFLFCVFCVPANAAAVPYEDFGGRRLEARLERFESYFEDDSRAATLFNAINAKRAAAGLPAYSFDYEAADFAMLRVREIVTYWTHTRPDGTQVHDENLAKHFQAHSNAPQAVCDAWSVHPGHLEKIYSTQYTAVGIASYVDEYGRDYYAAEFR